MFSPPQVRGVRRAYTPGEGRCVDAHGNTKSRAVPRRLRAQRSRSVLSRADRRDDHVGPEPRAVPAHTPDGVWGVAFVSNVAATGVLSPVRPIRPTAGSGRSRARPGWNHPGPDEGRSPPGLQRIPQVVDRGGAEAQEEGRASPRWLRVGINEGPPGAGSQTPPAPPSRPLLTIESTPVARRCKRACCAGFVRSAGDVAAGGPTVARVASGSGRGHACLAASPVPLTLHGWLADRGRRASRGVWRRVQMRRRAAATRFRRFAEHPCTYMPAPYAPLRLEPGRAGDRGGRRDGRGDPHVTGYTVPMIRAVLRSS